MTGLLTALAAATPLPSPSPSVVPAGGGSPGFLGFVFTFGLAVAAACIFLSLTRHLRIVDRRAREQAEQDERDEQATSDTTDHPGDASPADHPVADRTGPAGPVPPTDDERRA